MKELQRTYCHHCKEHKAIMKLWITSKSHLGKPCQVKRGVFLKCFFFINTETTSKK